MAAAKKAGKKKAPTKPASGSEAKRAALLEQAEQIPIRYDAVLVELSRAEASRRLLVQACELFDSENLDWIEGFASEELAVALEDARAAYVKAVGNRAVGNKPAPATEAAR